MPASPYVPHGSIGRASGLGWRWLPIALVVAALALRLSGATDQSLWYDEGTSASLASRSVADILGAAANDIHPPLYYLLLAAWTRLVGQSVFAMRALSATTGALLVALVFALGRRLWGVPAATAAAAVATVSPFLVWYGQEVRMYILAATLGGALLWAALEVATGRRPLRPWLATVLLASALLYTQYFVGASAIAAASAAFAAWLVLSPASARTGASRRVAAWMAALALAFVLFAPWLHHAWPAVRDWPSVGPALSPGEMLAAAAEAYALGPRVPPAAAAWIGLVLLLPLLAIATGLTPARRRATLTVTAHVLTPVTLLIAAATFRSAWDPKLLIAGAPTFELLAGAGVASLWRWRRRTWLPSPARTRIPLTAALLLLCAASAPRLRTLAAVRTDPAYQRDDYEAIAETIENQAGLSDAVVLTAPTQIEVFEIYDRLRHDTYPLPQGRRAPPEDTRARLESLAERHRDLYGVLWAADEADPEGVVEGWLNANRYKVFDTWFGNVRLARWAAAREPMATRQRPWSDGGTSLPFSFGVDAEALSSGDDEVLLVNVRSSPTLVPGDVLTLEAWWVAGRHRSPRADYVVFAHLVDATGAIVAQRDMPPEGGTARTSTWAPRGTGGLDGEWVDGEVVVDAGSDVHRDRIGLAIPDGLLGGDYRLLLGLYDQATGQRLTVVPFVTDPREPFQQSDAVVVGPYAVDDGS